MQYFLSREKMSIFFKFFFVTDFLNGKIERDEFLKELDLFKSNLGSENITENDIEVLKRELSPREYHTLVKSLPKKAKSAILGLKNPDPLKRKLAINALASFNLATVIHLGEQMLKDPDPSVRRYTIEFLVRLKSANSVPLIKNMLEDIDGGVRDSARNALSNLHTLMGHKLYQESDSSFFTLKSNRNLVQIKRREFGKGGSRLILLGGKLAGQAIVRIVHQEGFLAWKKALEAREYWVKAGFEYTPVEPILMKNGKLLAQKFITKKAESGQAIKWWESDQGNDIMYRVYTKVLGPNLGDFLLDPLNNQFKSDLRKSRRLIMSVLRKLKVWHGHLHEGNFCVEMYQSRPRLYVIDFDLEVGKWWWLHTFNWW